MGVPPHDLGVAGGVYIMKNTASAFCSPVVPMDMVSPEVVNKLKEEKHSLSDWIKKFLVLRRLDHIKSEGVSSPSFEDEESRVVKATVLDTPMTTTKSMRKTSVTFAVDNFSPHRKILAGDITEVVRRVQQDPSIIPTVVRQVEDSVMEAGELIQALSKDQSQAKKGTVNSMESLGLQLEKLQMEIGPREELQEEFQAPTLWGIIQAITGSLSQSEPSVQLEATEEDKILQIEADLSKTATFVRSLQMDTLARLQTLQAESKGWVDSLRTSLVKGLQGLISCVGNVEQQVVAISQQQAASSSMGSGAFGLNSAHLSSSNSSNSNLATKTAAMETELRALQTLAQQGQLELQRMKSKVDSSAIKFGNLGLSSIDD